MLFPKVTLASPPVESFEPFYGLQHTYAAIICTCSVHKDQQLSDMDGAVDEKCEQDQKYGAVMAYEEGMPMLRLAVLV